MKRREFIKACGLTVVSASSLSLLGACQKEQVIISGLPIENSEMVVDKKLFKNGNKTVLLEHKSYSHPICLFKTDEESYSASLMSCTHQRCTIAVKDDAYVCPCHGARFTNTGKVIKGPAEEDLKTFPVRITETDVYILVT